jgi:hypothetical protein
MLGHGCGTALGRIVFGVMVERTESERLGRMNERAGLTARIWIVLALIVLPASSLSQAQGQPGELPGKDPEAFKLAYGLWRAVECVAVPDYMGPYDTGEPGQLIYPPQKIRRYVKLQLVRELPVIALCKEPPDEVGRGKSVIIRATVRAEEGDDSIAYFVEITATIYGGQEVRESTRQSITWESPGTLGDTPRDSYEQSVKDALASEVKEFAQFVLKVRELTD